MTRKPDATPSVLDVKPLSLESWMDRLRDPPEQTVFIRNMFPTDRHRLEFMANVRERPEEQVKLLLRHFLVRTGSSPHDREMAAWVASGMKTSGDARPVSMHELRLLNHHISDGRYPAWEGLYWVIDLLPRHPREALSVLDAFFLSCWGWLTDNYLSGLFDAQALIRERYLVGAGPGNAQAHNQAVLASLSPRDFEWLCGVLFNAMGYEVVVTPRSDDNGADVVCSRTSPGSREVVLVQAKKYAPTTKVKKDHVRQVLGAVDDLRANRGVLATTGHVQSGARDFHLTNSRVEVLGAPKLLALLVQHCGADWGARVDRLITVLKNSQSGDG